MDVAAAPPNEGPFALTSHADSSVALNLIAYLFSVLEKSQLWTLGYLCPFSVKAQEMQGGVKPCLKSTTAVLAKSS